MFILRTIDASYGVMSKGTRVRELECGVYAMSGQDGIYKAQQPVYINTGDLRQENCAVHTYIHTFSPAYTLQCTVLYTLCLNSVQEM